MLKDRVAAAAAAAVHTTTFPAAAGRRVLADSLARDSLAAAVDRLAVVGRACRAWRTWMMMMDLEWRPCRGRRAALSPFFG